MSRSCVSRVDNVKRHAFENKKLIASCKDKKIPTLGDMDPETVYENHENFKYRVKAEFVKFLQLGNELGLASNAAGQCMAVYSIEEKAAARLLETGRIRI